MSGQSTFPPDENAQSGSRDLLDLSPSDWPVLPWDEEDVPDRQQPDEGNQDPDDFFLFDENFLLPPSQDIFGGGGGSQIIPPSLAPDIPFPSASQPQQQQPPPPPQPQPPGSSSLRPDRPLDPEEMEAIELLLDMGSGDRTIRKNEELPKRFKMWKDIHEGRGNQQGNKRLAQLRHYYDLLKAEPVYKNFYDRVLQIDWRDLIDKWRNNLLAQPGVQVPIYSGPLWKLIPEYHLAMEDAAAHFELLDRELGQCTITGQYSFARKTARITFNPSYLLLPDQQKKVITVIQCEFSKDVRIEVVELMTNSLLVKEALFKFHDWVWMKTRADLNYFPIQRNEHRVLNITDVFLAQFNEMAAVWRSPAIYIAPISDMFRDRGETLLKVMVQFAVDMSFRHPGSPELLLEVDAERIPDIAEYIGGGRHKFWLSLHRQLVGDNQDALIILPKFRLVARKREQYRIFVEVIFPRIVAFVADIYMTLFHRPTHIFFFYVEVFEDAPEFIVPFRHVLNSKPRVGMPIMPQYEWTDINIPVEGTATLKHQRGSKFLYNLRAPVINPMLRGGDGGGGQEQESLIITVPRTKKTQKEQKGGREAPISVESSGKDSDEREKEGEEEEDEEEEAAGATGEAGGQARESRGGEEDEPPSKRPRLGACVACKAVGVTLGWYVRVALDGCVSGVVCPACAAADSKNKKKSSSSSSSSSS